MLLAIANITWYLFQYALWLIHLIYQKVFAFETAKKPNDTFISQNPSGQFGVIQVLRNAIFLEIGPPPTPS